MPDPTQITWIAPTLNTDGSPITAGEITGYEVGIRDTAAAGSAAGTYPFRATAPATATSELLSLLSPVLPKGVPLVAAARALTAAVDASGNPVDSAWSAESAPFQLTPPAPVPQAPTGISVA